MAWAEPAPAGMTPAPPRATTTGAGSCTAGPWVAATAAAICSGDRVLIRAAETRRAPQDWQKVRVPGLAIPHSGQRTRDPPEPSPAGARSAVPAGSATTRAAPAISGSPADVDGAASDSDPADSPSHSRKALHDPQNRSSGSLADPQRRQITWPSRSVTTTSGTGATAARRAACGSPRTPAAPPDAGSRASRP